MDPIETAKTYAREHESEKRFAHTRGVASDCKRLARIFGLDDATTEKLIVAGWLHDSTKELPPAAQKEICDRFGVPEPPDGYGSPTIHAVTAAYLTRSLFPDIVDDTVFSAIRYHTTGSAKMSLTDMIVCFADYTEESRKYETCRSLRAKFYGTVTKENRTALLTECLLEAFNATITSLSSRGDYIDPETFEAQRVLSALSNSNEVHK